MIAPARYSCADAAARPLTLKASGGEQLQVLVLEEDVVRVRFLPDGQPRQDRTWMVVGADGDTAREGRERDDLTPFTLPRYGVEPSGDVLSLQTACLRLDVTLADGRMRWADAGGRIFAADVSGRAYAYDAGGRSVAHTLEWRPDEHYYGFGERAGPLDKGGMRMRMLDRDAFAYDARVSDPLYKHFPFYITFVPRLRVAYGLFYDNLASCVFDMGHEADAQHGRYRSYQADDGDLDYYLLYGPSIERVVEQFSRLTGRMALPPRWSLGYLGSTMSYTEAANAQEQLEVFIHLCAEHRIPCDLFHLSSGYTTGVDGNRHVFTWNRDKIPAPERLAEAFHQSGMRLAANIKPCLLTSHPQYAEVSALGAFVQAAHMDTPEVNPFWGSQGSYIDFTSAAGYGWWKERVRDSLLMYGIDVTWNDNNEFESWNEGARCAGFGKPLTLGLLRPVQSLLMTRASHEAQHEARPGERPFVISRSGCPGIQRYAQTWSGDNVSSWETLRYNIPMGLGLSLSGAPNTGHDVGGFAGDRPEPELFVRWVQNGIFHPRFTIHSWHVDGSVNAPWMYPDVLPIVRETIELRYRLIPYLYSLFVEAARTGHPIIRPLVYAFPEDERCAAESFDFLLGPNLLVASVLEPGARTRSVYLPGSGEWIDYYRGTRYRGGQTVDIDAPLERIPLLVPAGGIVPMGKVMRHVGERPDDLRQVYVFPHASGGNGRFVLTEDDGVSLGYRHGESTDVTLEVASEPDAIVLRVSTLGHFPLPYTHVEWILPPGERRTVVAEGDKRLDEDGRWRVLVPLRPADIR
jgi:alpha-glucosidase